MIKTKVKKSKIKQTIPDAFLQLAVMVVSSATQVLIINVIMDF